MNYSIIYKKRISIALLVLYAFIATPTQLWHQHNHAPNNDVQFKSVSKGKIVTPLVSINENQEEDCKICAHHYSAFYNDALTLNIKAPIFYLDKSISSYLSYTHSAIKVCENKGPPKLV